MSHENLALIQELSHRLRSGGRSPEQGTPKCETGNSGQLIREVSTDEQGSVRNAEMLALSRPGGRNPPIEKPVQRHVDRLPPLQNALLEFGREERQAAELPLVSALRRLNGAAVQH